MMNRSKRCVFVSFCYFAQGIRASGIVRKFPATVTPLISMLMENNINIFQMPCPELEYDSLQRQPHGKSFYDKPTNRIICRKISEVVADQMAMLIKGGYRIEAIIGIDRSPSCAVNIISAGQRKGSITGKGIFIEELNKVLNKRGIKIPFFGINLYRINEDLRPIENVIRR